jgi:protein O-mannosyl-transferase
MHRKSNHKPGVRRVLLEKEQVQDGEQFGGSQTKPESTALHWTLTDTIFAGLGSLLVFAAYAQTLRFEFVLDDFPLILQSPLVLVPWRSVPQFFVEGYFDRIFPTDPHNVYRPLLSVWLVLNQRLWGFYPGGWHLVAVLLTALATLGVYALGRRVLHSRPLAALAAMLFALHPIHVESTAWVIGMNESLMAVPFLASILAYLRSRDAGPESSLGAGPRRGVWLGVSLVCFALALLAKEESIVLPALVAGFVWVYGRQEKRSGRAGLKTRLRGALSSSAPYWGLAVVYLALRFEILRGLSHTATQMPFAAIPRTIPAVLWSDIRLLVWPSGLSIFYASPYVSTASFSNFVLPSLLVLAVAGSFVAWGRRSRAAAWAAMWVFIPILPFLDLPILPDGDFVHDRYLYLSSVGFVLLLALAVREAGERLQSRVKPALVQLLVFAALGLAYGKLTLTGSRFWANQSALYTHAATTSPGSNFALDGLAHLYAERGQCAAAAAIYQKVLARSPRYWMAYLNLGACHYNVGNYEGALDYLGRAAELSPGDPDVLFFIGLAQFRLRHFDVAEVALRRAVEIRPFGVGYHLALGMVLEAEGDRAHALAEFRRELAYHPDESAARAEIGK